MKDKIEYTCGCVCNSLSVNGEETSEMEVNKLKEIICKLINAEKQTAVLQDILIDLVETNGEHKHLGTCDCCGDSIDKWTLEI